jgi:hypothetical protein
MSYPTLTARAADNLAGMLGRQVDEDERRKQLVMCEGPPFDAAAVIDAASRAQSEWIAEVQAREARGEAFDEYLLEAFMASRLHRTLRDVPTEILQDFGFWRYLALFPYCWYLQLREGGPSLVAVKPQDYGGSKPNGAHAAKEASPQYQLMLRTFLWGKIAFDKDDSPDHYLRATLVNETNGAVIDVWHSHIVRIQLGQLGTFPHAFLDSICSDPKANGRDPARDVEKELTRMKHTVLFDVYDLDEARKIVDAKKEIVLAKPRTKS